MKQYGNLNDVRAGYPLAAWIWGHRLRVGQHWMEYLLEFLNVLAGFDYRLGQGVTDDGRSVSPHYTRFGRLGLRRFVFYDEHEKTRHAYDTAAIERLRTELSQATWLTTADSTEEPFLLAKKLLRSFSAVEEQRSWYAKSLLPAHHDMLFWEALRKGATKADQKQGVTPIDLSELDDNIAYDARNFFARGGELYYLMLSAGTRDDQELGVLIQSLVRRLLVERNPLLGSLARSINEAWEKVVATNGDDPDTGSLGWIPDPDCALYRQITEDVTTLLEAPIDPLEILDLLAHLISFHTVLYIYHRAQPGSDEAAHADGTCLETCRPMLMIDLQDSEGQPVRTVAAATFRDQDALIRQTAATYVRQRVNEWLKENKGELEDVNSMALQHFALKQLHGKTRGPFDRRVEEILTALRSGKASRQDALRQYTEALEGLLFNDFDRNFKGVHTKLAKAIGFVAPHKGPNPRFVLSDTLLRAITFAVIRPNAFCTFHDFLRLLYERFGLVIGLQEAQQAQLVDRYRINTESYQRNATAFLEKLQHAGLAVEYSDATAMVFGSRA